MKQSIEYSDFEKLELRVGKVVRATVPDWSNKLLELTVDFGPEIGSKTVLSGVRKWYQPSDFEGQNFPFVINLAPRKMGQATSEGMMIMADLAQAAEHPPVLLPLPPQLPAGSTLR